MKKKNGWKIAFFVLLILIVAFAIWLMIPGEEEPEPKQGASAYGVTQSGTAEPSTPITVNDVIREKQSSVVGNGKDKVTILMFMNGSDLESDYGEASTDLTEMVKGMSGTNVNFIVQTMSTKKWSNTYNISNKHSQRFELTSSGLTLVDDSLGQLSCCESSTLEDFVKWGASNYPADRYILLFWDHGGGPVYGYGYDDYNDSDDMLTTDEIQTALKNAGVFFDIIGMDCCLMSCMEVCCALYDYCDYMILSEDFESGYGWSYTDWVSMLCSNTSVASTELGKKIIDDMVDYNERNGEDAIMALIDQSYMKVLYSSWVDFAYSNSDSLFDTNYSRRTSRRSHGGRVHPAISERKDFFSNMFWGEEDDYEMSDYYITDIMAVAENINADESRALAASVNQALAYVNSCGGSSSLTGISVTLPYGDSDFYGDLEKVLTNCGFDDTYIEWLYNFVTSSSYDSFYNYDSWDDEWSGWDDYEDDYDWDDWGSDWDSDWGSDWDDDYWDDDGYYDDWYDWGWSDDDWYYDDGYGGGWHDGHHHDGWGWFGW